ncbi:monovalent cation/H(+) antiporter subunit G, partial [Bacillus spizizenii]|nr:monovalent cation/H(+) antiporter subunit G [Bacillus spizizenii]
MIEIAKVVVAVFILLGALVCLVASLGVIRLPDMFTRSHAASKGSTLGVNMILLGVFFYLWFVTGNISAKILLGILFIFITSPV